MRKTLFYICCLISLITAFSSCCNNDDYTPEPKLTYSGHVSSFDQYGMLVPSFTPQELLAAGFDYSDYLDVKVGDSITLHNVPFVSSFNEVGVFDLCFCNYNKNNKVYGFGHLNGNFQERIGGQVGDSVIVSLATHHGYYDTWLIMQSVYTCDREDYPDETDEEFANFREVTTTGMDSKVLYRSSNPMNPKHNPTRYAYVDSLAKHYGIKSEVDLADTDEKVIKYALRPDYLRYGVADGYCYQELFQNDKIVTLGLTADIFGKTFMETLATGLKFMISNQPPYLLHCNEGKDRCGFVSFLLEAIAGATYQEVADDYMKTLMNFYQIDKVKDAKSYNLRQSLSIDRMVWLLGNFDTKFDFETFTWEGKDPKTVNLQQSAIKYLKACGLTDDECSKLKTILQTGRK